ncbi:hypothetical protein B0T10DRAFT_595744 [Thelonectria olida]|uniref:Bulb-type lectin domain-containing protein n=1 Tax=Thelonectria olida TaxID=1576542 RepID=A0A9P8W9A4_9HYPO|nr:hypothetical protein B0T10DRAFT_595744 [Thelonectria olida]
MANVEAPSPTLHVIYAGRGDAFVLEYKIDGNRVFVITDGGPSDAPYDAKKAAPYSKYFTASVADIWAKWPNQANTPLQPSAIINSHTDEDHYEGILKLIKTSLPSAYQVTNPLPAVNPPPAMIFNGNLYVSRARKWKGNSYVLDNEKIDSAFEKFDAVLKPKKFKDALNKVDDPVTGIKFAYPAFKDLCVYSRSAPNVPPLFPPGTHVIPDDLDAASEGTGASPREMVRIVPRMADLDDSTTNLSSIIMWTDAPKAGGCIVTTGDNVGYRIVNNCSWTTYNPLNLDHIQVYKIQHHGSVRNSQLIGKDNSGNLIGDVNNPATEDQKIAVECAVRELAEQTWGVMYDQDPAQWINHEPSHREPFFCPSATSPDATACLNEACALLQMVLTECLTPVLHPPTNSDYCEWLASLRRRHASFLIHAGYTGALDQRPQVQIPGCYKDVSPIDVYEKLWDKTRKDAFNAVSQWTDYARKNPSLDPADTKFAKYSLRRINPFFSWDTFRAQSNEAVFVPTDFWSFWNWEETKKSTKYWLAYYTSLDSIRRVQDFYDRFDSDTYVVSANGSHGHPSPSVIAGLAMVVASRRLNRCLFITNGFAISPSPICSLLYWVYRASGKDDAAAKVALDAALGANGFLTIKYLARGVYMSIDGSQAFTGGAANREFLSRTDAISMQNGVGDLETLYKTLETDKTVLPRRSSGRAVYTINCQNATLLDWKLDLTNMANQQPHLLQNAAPLHEIQENWESGRELTFKDDMVAIHVIPLDHPGADYTFWLRGKPNGGYLIYFENNNDEWLICAYKSYPTDDAHIGCFNSAGLHALIANNGSYETLLFKFEKHTPPPPNIAPAPNMNVSFLNVGSSRQTIPDLNLMVLPQVVQVAPGASLTQQMPGRVLPIQQPVAAVVQPGTVITVAPSTTTTMSTNSRTAPAVPVQTTTALAGKGEKIGPRTTSLEVFCKAASIRFTSPGQPWSVRDTLAILLGSRNMEQVKFTRPIEKAALDAKIRTDDVKVTFEDLAFNAAVLGAQIAFTPPGATSVKIDDADLKVSEGAMNIDWSQEKGIANSSPPVAPDFKALALPKLLGLLTRRTPQDMTMFLMDRLPAILIKHQFLQQAFDVDRSSAVVLPLPVGEFFVQEAEIQLVSTVSKLGDAVKEALQIANGTVVLENVKIILLNAGTTKEIIQFKGGVTVSDVQLTFEVNMTDSPSTDMMNPAAVAWTFTAQKFDTPLSNISQLWKAGIKTAAPGSKSEEKLDDFSQKKAVPFSTSPLTQLKHSGIGFVVSQQVPRIGKYEISSIFARTSLTDWRNLLPSSLPIYDANGTKTFDATAYVEVRNPLDSGMRALAVALDFEIEVVVQKPAAQKRRLKAVLMAEPISGTNGYDYRIAISSSDNGVTVPDVVRAVGYGAELDQLTQTLPILGELNKLQLKNLSVALQEQKNSGKASSYTLGEFALGFTLEDLPIYKKIRLVSAEVDLQYCAGFWEARARGVLALDTKRLEASLVLPQSDTPGSIEITAPGGLNIGNVLQATEIDLPMLKDLPFPEIVNAITQVTLDRIKIDLARQDKSIVVSGSALELTLPNLKFGGFVLFDAQAKIDWVTAVEAQTNKPQKYLSVSVEAATRDRNFAASVTYDAMEQTLSILFSVVKPRKISDLLKLLQLELQSSQLLDMIGDLGLVQAAVQFNVTTFKPTAFSISLTKNESVEVDKVAIGKLELSYVAERATIPKNDTALHLRDGEKMGPTPAMLNLRGTTTGKGTSASVSLLATWGAGKPSSISVVITPPSDSLETTLSIKSLVGLFKWPGTLPDPKVPDGSQKLDFLSGLNILHASGNVAFGAKGATKVQIESLRIVIESQQKYPLPDMPDIVLEGLSLKVDYDRTNTKAPFQGTIWAYLRLPQDLILGLQYIATKEGNDNAPTWRYRYYGDLSMAKSTPQGRLLTFEKMAERYLGSGKTATPPNVNLPSPLRMTLVTADYVPGEKFEIYGGDTTLDKAIGQFGSLEIKLTGIGGRVVKNLGKASSYEAMIYGSLALKSLTSTQAGAVLHITAGSTKNAILIAELRRTARPPSAPGQPTPSPSNDVAEIVNAVGGQAQPWKTLAPEITQQDLAFKQDDALSKLVLDFGRKNFIVTGRIVNVGQALLWIREREQNDLTASGTAKKTTYSYLLCLDLESVTALWPSLATSDDELGSAWLSFDKVGISAQLSSDDISAAEIQTQLDLLNGVVPAPSEQKDTLPSGPLVKSSTALKESASIAAKGAELMTSPSALPEAPLIRKGVRVQARIVLDDRTKLSKMLALSSDPDPGKPPRVDFEAMIPTTKGVPATYSITMTDFRMFDGLFILRYGQGSYSGKKHKIELNGRLEFYFDKDHTYKFNVAYWTQDEQTGFEFTAPSAVPTTTASTTPAPATTSTTQSTASTTVPVPSITNASINPTFPTPQTQTFSIPTLPTSGDSQKTAELQVIAFPEMFGVSLKMSKLRGTISPSKPGATKKEFSCIIHGSIDVFNRSLGGQVVFIGAVPRALVFDIVNEVPVSQVYTDIINGKKSATVGESWPSDYEDIKLKSARVYYLRSTDSKDETVVLGSTTGKPEDATPVTLRPGFNLSATIDILEEKFVILVGIRKNGVEISGAYQGEIDFGFCVLTKTASSIGPQVTISSLSETKTGGMQTQAKKQFEVSSGISILKQDGFSLSLKYQSGGAYEGTASYDKSIPIGDTEIKGPLSITIRYEKGRFSFNGINIKKNLDLDIEEALRLGSNKVDTQCEKLVGKLFDKIVKTKFSWTIGMGGVKKGALTVLIGGKFNLSILNSNELSVDFDMPANLTVELKPDIFSFSGLLDCICESLKTNASLTRLGEQILTNKENTAKIFGCMTVKNLAKKVIAALLCRKIAPPNIWPVVDDNLPPDDKDPGKKPNPNEQPTSWWDKFKTVVEVVLVAGAVVAALVGLGEALAAFAEFMTVASETLTLLERAIECLKAARNLSSIEVAKLARFENLRTAYQSALKNAPTQLANARLQIRQNLNLTTKPEAKFFPKNGVFRLDLSKAKPAAFTAGATASKLSWDIVVLPTNTKPSNDQIPDPKQTSVTEDKLVNTSLELNRPDLKGATGVYAWARISYTDSLGAKSPGTETFMSETWMPVDIVTVDDEVWKSRLNTDFTMKNGPSVLVVNGPNVQADWTSNQPAEAKAPEKYQDIGKLQWEVLASLSSDPDSRVAGQELVRELLPITTTKWEKKVDPKLLGMPTPSDGVMPMVAVYVHTRAVMDVTVTGSRIAGSWVTGRMAAPKNTLNPGEWLKAGEYLVAAGGKLRFALQGDGNFVVAQLNRALWASNTYGTDSKNLRAAMMLNGNLELQQVAVDGSVSSVRWSTDTASKAPSDGRAGASLVLQEDGNAVIRAADGKTIIWQTGKKAQWPPSQKDRLQVGEVLWPDDRLASPNGRFALVFQGDGNFVLYDVSRPIWAINTDFSTRPLSVTLGEDDNLVVDRTWNVWQTGTRRRLKGGRGQLIVRDDGAVVLISDGTIIWSTNASLVQPYEPVDLVQCKAGSEFLRPGEYLAKGQWLASPNGIYTAILQNDGNFAVYQTNSSGKLLLWATSTMSDTVTRLCFGLVPRQLNLYGAGAQVRWSSQPGREYDSDNCLRIGNDGNLAILPITADPYDYSGKTNRAWSSGTALFDSSGKTNSSLAPGQCMTLNNKLVSDNGKYVFSFNKTGEISILTFGNQTPNISFAWNPRGDQVSPVEAAMLCCTPSGHLEMRDSAGKQMWREGPGESSRPIVFIMRDDGLATFQVIPKGGPLGDVIWWMPQPIGDRLATSQTLWPNQCLRSPNGAFAFVLQGDCNIVLYKFSKPSTLRPSGHSPVWASNSWSSYEKPDRMVLQPDGNLVFLKGSYGGPRPAWSTNSNVPGGGPVNRVLVLQDNGDCVLLDDKKNVVWPSHTVQILRHDTEKAKNLPVLPSSVVMVAAAGAAVDKAGEMVKTIAGAHMALRIAPMVRHLENSVCAIANVVTSGTSLFGVEVAAAQVAAADLSDPILGLVELLAAAPVRAAVVAFSRGKAEGSEHSSVGRSEMHSGK